MILLPTLLVALMGNGPASDSTLKVDASKILNRITPYMYGSCIEDVNHEIYGGLYAQMIFGESFEEPPLFAPGWRTHGGEWIYKEGVLSVKADFGAKAVNDIVLPPQGRIYCELRFKDEKGENAGLILRVREPRIGADTWTGYEISLSAKHQTLMLGRHRDNFQMLQTVPMKVEVGKWHRLTVDQDGPKLSIYVDELKQPAIVFEDRSAPIPDGRVGVRTWGSDVEFRSVGLTVPEGFAPSLLLHGSHVVHEGREVDQSLSGMWDWINTGSAVLKETWDTDRPYNAAHSQRIERLSGPGTVGIANSGLNRWGLAVHEGRRYQGYVYLRQEGYVGKVTVALQSADGKKSYAHQELNGLGPEWKRFEFSLEPNATDTNSRFALTIDGPGKVWVDQVYLAPTGENLFHGLPFRGDIGRALQKQGLTLLRYGGCMVNAPEYRWKRMIGDRDKRPQYKGWWNPQSTNGFGIEEFLIFCKAAGFEPVVSINVEETPQDVADLIDYLNGPVTTEWGRRRAENGHPEPYNLRYLQLGNEETTNAHYIERFKILHDAIRPRDAKVELIIAAWWEPDNPVSRRIVQELDGKAALWDVHVGGDDPREGAKVDALFTRMERLVREWAPGTKLKACVLEENGGRHDIARALGHASVLNATQRHGDFVLIDCPANCLQAWKQNDNGWDQGQLFYTSDKVWGMPPYYAQQMAAAAHLPCRVASQVTSPGNDLDVTSTRDEDGRTLVLKVVNAGNQAHRTDISLDGFGPLESKAEVTTLSGALDDRNTPEAPERIVPKRSAIDDAGARFSYEFPARSYTILKLTRAAGKG
jgi:alpha-L-arabinofuranosidase